MRIGKMKKIAKRKNTPRKLQQWLRGQENVNCSYAEMPNEVRKDVKDNLLAEQGFLCCYTGISIDKDCSHIEHLKPQAKCLNGEDVDYKNLMAAYPAPNSEQSPFGAHPKGDWYEADLFVHPLRSDCESKFKFTLNGKIKPVSAADADETIKRLKLDNGQLEDLRKAAIDELIFSKNHPLSKAAAESERDRIFEKNNGKFREFCFVLSQCLQEHIERLDRKHTKNSAIRREENR